MAKREVIIKATHRGLWYQDGVLQHVMEAGRYEYLTGKTWWGKRRPKIEVVLVDMRERDLTIKGQEILTADKVAIRVSIIVQYKVLDPEAALHKVTNYEERIYSDVQLAARRSLASMTLEEILTNRNRLSEDILADVQESASGFGVSVLRAAVKDLIFPGNLQEIMNRVLAAERRAEAELIEARAKAERDKLEAETNASTQRLQAETRAASVRSLAESEAEAQRVRTAAEVAALESREKSAEAYSKFPALMRLRELNALQDLSKNANARIYVGFDKHMPRDADAG